jgi:hypothetical protein
MKTALNLLICLYVVILAALLLTPAPATPAPAPAASHYAAPCTGDDSFYNDGRQPDFAALSKLFH